MKYRFEKKIVYDVEADSLSDAREIMKINDFDSLIKDIVQGDLEDSVGSWSIGLDIDENEVLAMIDCCDTKVFDSEYVGGNSKNDPEKRLYNHLTDKACPTKTVYLLNIYDEYSGTIGIFSTVEKAKQIALEDFKDRFCEEGEQVTITFETNDEIKFEADSGYSSCYEIAEATIDGELGC